MRGISLFHLLLSLMGVIIMLQDFHKDSDGSYRVVFEQQKTDGEIINKINQKYLIPIFDKYSGGFPEFFEVHNYNDLLKKAASK